MALKPDCNKSNFEYKLNIKYCSSGGECRPEIKKNRFKHANEHITQEALLSMTQPQ